MNELYKALRDPLLTSHPYGDQTLLGLKNRPVHYLTSHVLSHVGILSLIFISKKMQRS